MPSLRPGMQEHEPVRIHRAVVDRFAPKSHDNLFGDAGADLLVGGGPDFMFNEEPAFIAGVSTIGSNYVF